MRTNFSILMVCTGNVCRSPFAEHLLLSHLSAIPEIKVSSAGTHALVAQPMFETTQQIARSYGVEATESHRARQLREADLEASDLILAMTREHRRHIVELSPRVIRRTFTLREFAKLAEVTTEEDLTSEIDLSGDSPIERLRAAVIAATFGRSVLSPLADPAEDDVIDPYRRSDEVHEASARQLVPAIDSIVSLLRRSLEGVSNV